MPFNFIYFVLQIYAVSITIRIVVSKAIIGFEMLVLLFLFYAVYFLSLCYTFQQFGFMFIALIWKFDFAPFMVLIIAILNDGKI